MLTLSTYCFGSSSPKPPQSLKRRSPTPKNIPEHLKVPDNSSGSAIRKNSDTPSSTHANSGGSGSWSWVSKLSKGVKTKVRVPSRKKTLPLSDAPPPLEAKKRVENWLSNPEKAESPIRNYTPAEQVDADFKGLLGDE